MAAKLNLGYNNNYNNDSYRSMRFAKTLLPPNCDTTPFNCNADLRGTFFLNSQIKTSDTIYYGKTGTSYKDREYTSSNPKLEDCGVNAPCETNPDSSLHYFTYYPRLSAYGYSCPLLVIFLLHPGGFSDCNHIGPGIRLMGAEFARRGFICVVAEYRRGIINDTVKVFPNSIDPHLRIITYTGAQQISAYYKPTQDCSGLIRTFIQRQRDGADEFKADTNNIFLGGGSAGAEIITLLTYYTQSMIDSVSENIHAALGPIDIDYYKGGTNIEYKSKIKGLLFMWGTAFLPLNYVNNPVAFFAQNPNNVAMIAFHGFKDTINPLTTEAVYFSPAGDPHKTYHATKECLLPMIDSFNVTPRTITGGPLLIDEYRGGPRYYYDNHI